MPRNTGNQTHHSLPRIPARQRQDARPCIPSTSNPLQPPDRSALAKTRARIAGPLYRLHLQSPLSARRRQAHPRFLPSTYSYCPSLPGLLHDCIPSISLAAPERSHRAATRAQRRHARSPRRPAHPLTRRSSNRTRQTNQARTDAIPVYCGNPTTHDMAIDINHEVIFTASTRSAVDRHLGQADGNVAFRH